MQGGYNGNHDELACNVLNTLDEIGPHVSPGEYPLRPLGAGTTLADTRFVHPINFNDIESVRYVCRRYPVAALITEPVLQNIGVVRPQPGYLASLRQMADEYGFLLILNEVKTGFRHALGGYSAIEGIRPDLLVYGKAIANGFPLAVLGGKSKYMDYIVHSDHCHDIIQGHDFVRDLALRRALISRGVFFPPIATEQCSISVTHSIQDIQFTLDQLKTAVATTFKH